MRVLAVFFLILPILFQGCAGIPLSVKEGDEYFNKKQYVNAGNAYEISLTKVDDPNLRQEIEEKIALIKINLTDQYLADAKEVYSRRKPVTVPMINEAAGVLENGLKWDDGNGRIADKIRMYQREKNQIVQKNQEKREEAVRQTGRFNYNRAEELMDQALVLDPSNSDLQSLKGKISIQKELYKEIEKYLRAGDLKNAGGSFDRLSDAAGNNIPLSGFPLNETFAKLILQKVSDFKRDNRWYDAYQLLKNRDFTPLDGALNDVRSRGSDYYYKAAKLSVENENNYYKGYLYSTKAIELNSNEIKIFRINKKTRDHIDNSVQKYIAVASFDSPSNDPDAGKQFSDSLSSYLYQMLPYGINILERDKIDFVLKEQRTETKSAGKMLGADLIVTGAVSLYKVDKLVDERMATIKIKIGEEMVENPEFLQMAAIYGVDSTVWPKIPPRTIRKDNFQLLNYKKGEAQIKGFAKVSIRIFDTSKGTITFVKDFDAAVVMSSEFQDEVKDAGIPYIPIDLPSNTEIKEEMRKGIVARIAKIVRASFENREIRFLNEADFFIERKEYESAFKPLAEGYFYCAKDNIPPDNEACLNINNLIYDLIGWESLIPKKRVGSLYLPELTGDHP